jgi:hypothetical protein
VAASAVNLTADANDPDGVITKVEFYSGASKLGEDTASPFAFSWPSVPAGQHILRAIASDDSGLSRTSAPVNITALAGFTSNVTFVATGAVWRYRDTGENLGNAWNAIALNDTTWSNGPAQLGYGDGDERTIVSYGPNASAKYTTTYFRSSFDVGDPTAFNSLNLRVMRDDGVVIYLNGSEVFRDNMPAGAINYLTAAVNAIGGADESTFYSAALNPGYLVFGKNTLAAEIHQQNGTSTDISFDFELAGGQTFIAPYFTQQPESQTAAEGTAVSLTPVVAGAAPLRFQWRFNGTNLPNATNSTLSFPGVQLANAGNYFVVVTNLAGSATSTVATLTISTSDTDHDGMPDFWEQAHGLDPGVNDAGTDSDGDGMTNFDEFIAGTHPRRADSYLKVDRISSRVGALTIEFLAVSNRTYTVLRRAFANVGSWKRLSDVPSHSTNRVAILMDTNAAPTQFYRLVTPSLP